MSSLTSLEDRCTDLEKENIYLKSEIVFLESKLKKETLRELGVKEDRYLNVDNRVYDVLKKTFITSELPEKDCNIIVCNYNELWDMIHSQIESGKYIADEYYKLLKNESDEDES